MANRKILAMLPVELKPDYEFIFFARDDDREHWRLVKAADKICAYLKCVEEMKAQNQEFAKAEKTIKADLDQFDLPEVAYFMENFVPSFSLTLDELN